ncbi:MAG TPA: ribokinase [Glaciihabitans sp.]|jgi:ribokinase|nr:ribokinase [Glaciihabitans sp.]
MTTPLIVMGSASRDYTVLVDRHPLPGETLLGGDIIIGSGGKGANQAVAASRAGGSPVFLGCFGDDTTGAELISNLDARGVDISHVTRTTQAPTGVALITVAASGENSIVVAAGANAHLTADATSAAIRSVITSAMAAGDVDLGSRTSPSGIVLAQLEVPLETVEAAAQVASDLGARFVLNLSPSRDIPDELLALCDPLVVNESEAAAVAGQPVDSIEDARRVAEALLSRCLSVVVTLGGDGVVVASGSQVEHLPAERVTVVDTTGAGDAFVGALVARLAQGGTLRNAVEVGISAGAKAVQHLGAQPA